jgi:hypothetical protein
MIYRYYDEWINSFRTNFEFFFLRKSYFLDDWNKTAGNQSGYRCLHQAIR